MRREVAYVFHTQPSEFATMTFAELCDWHQDAQTVIKQVYGSGRQ